MVDVLPDLASELRNALAQDGRAELAGQVSSLRIVQLCGCGDDFCASFYTGPQPDGAWGDGHENVVPDVDTGMLVLDVVDGVIRYVEVLYRDDVRSVLFPEDSAP